MRKHMWVGGEGWWSLQAHIFLTVVLVYRQLLVYPLPFPSLEHGLLIFTRLVFTTSLLSESLTQAMYSCTSLQVQSKI